jgi:DNA-binding transcriptional ArsR family regulator
MKHDVIDRLREQIQHRLDQIVNEADRLRRALAALDPRSSSAPARKDREQAGRARAGAAGPKASPTRGATSRPARAVPAPGVSATGGRPARRTADSAASSVRTAPGATRAAVLAALAGGEPMTAGELAEKSGLARATVSSTLSRLARSGEVQKAERGYRLAPTGATTESATGTVNAPTPAAPAKPTTNTAITTPGESADTAAGETAESAGAKAAETPAGGTARAVSGRTKPVNIEGA